MNTCDTIAAPATGMDGAVAIIRLSGPGALAAAKKIWRGRSKLDGPENLRKMLLGKVGSAPALAVYMKAPHSYTGDDVVELIVEYTPRQLDVPVRVSALPVNRYTQVDISRWL